MPACKILSSVSCGTGWGLYFLTLLLVVNAKMVSMDTSRAPCGGFIFIIFYNTKVHLTICNFCAVFAGDVRSRLENYVKP